MPKDRRVVYLHEMPIDELAAKIRSSGEWIYEELEALCSRANMMEEWLDADGEGFAAVAQEAASRLGVEIY